MIIKISKLSGHDKEATVGKIMVATGDTIDVGDVIVNLESKKGNFKVKSDVVGRVGQVFIEEGATAKIGDDMILIEATDCTSKPSEGTSKKTFEPNKSSGYNFGFQKQRTEKVKKDLVIVGGGPGGYVAAIKASQLGLSVAVVEKERFGGTCLNHGCIPTKALVKSAHVYQDIVNAEIFGIEIEGHAPNMTKIVNRKNDIVNTLVSGIEYLMDNYNVKVIKGEAKLDNEITIVDTKQVKYEVEGKNTIIATGSSAVKLNIVGADLKKVITSKEILNIKEVPKKLTIIGGGIIGMEFAFIFNALGSEVTVIEYFDDILALLDDDVLDVVKESCSNVGINLLTSSKAEQIVEAQDESLITKFVKEGRESYVVSDYVLMAVGRKANFDLEALNKQGIEIDEKYSGIKVNDKMQTTNDKFYAIGDVTNIIQLAHVASHQGIVAVENIAGIISTMKYDVVPSGIFIDPEVGIVGKSEKELRDSGTPYRVGKFPFSANGKALTNGSCEGFVKVITDMDDCIIGASIIGAGATDMIATFTPLIQNKMKANKMSHTIFAHPTTAESIHEAVLDLKGESLHNVSNNSVENTETTA